jgi:hypothetical protein
VREDEEEGDVLDVASDCLDCREEDEDCDVSDGPAGRGLGENLTLDTDLSREGRGEKSGFEARVLSVDTRRLVSTREEF